MQQIPFIDLFIDLFKYALHISGDKLAHHQEHFLTVRTVLVQCTDIAADRWQGHFAKSAPEDGRQTRPSSGALFHCLYRFWYNAPILLPTGDKVIVPKTVYTVKILSWGWASLSPETCRADLKRSINGICCILLVAYIVVLMMHGLTNIKFKHDLTGISTGDWQKDILVWFMLTNWNEKKSFCVTSLSAICAKQRSLACSKNNVLNIFQKIVEE